MSHECFPWPSPFPFSPGIDSEDLPDSVGLQQSPHQKPFWKTYFSTNSPMRLHPPIDDEGSGNRLHLTRISHPSMDVSDVVFVGLELVNSIKTQVI